MGVGFGVGLGFGVGVGFGVGSGVVERGRGPEPPASATGSGRRRPVTASRWARESGSGRAGRRWGSRSAADVVPATWSPLPRPPACLDRAPMSRTRRAARRQPSARHRRSPCASSWSDPSVPLALVLRLRPPAPQQDGTPAACASRRAGRDRLVSLKPDPAGSPHGADRLVGRDHLAGDLDVEVLHHSAPVGHHTRAGAGIPGCRTSRASSTSSAERGEHRVARLDLAGVDQGLAVEAQVASLAALRLEPVEVLDVVVDAVEDRDARPPGGQQREATARSAAVPGPGRGGRRAP